MSNEPNRQDESLSEIEALRARVADLERAEAKQEKTTAELRESLERFQLAAHGTLDGLWDWHVATGNVWWSPRYRELIGYEDDELPANYSSWESLLHPDDRERTLKAVHRHIEEGRAYDIEYRLRTKSRGYRWFHARGVVQKDATGQPIRMAGSIRDIADRKHGEEALRESEERFALFMKHLPGVAFISDHEGHLLFVNETYERVVGLKSKDLVGRRFDAVFPAEVAAHFANQDQAVLTQGRVLELDEIVTDKTGPRSWLTRKFPIQVDGRPTLIGGVSLDITKRRQAEAALRENEARLQATIESLPFDFFALDANGRYVLQNSACRERWGELVGKRPEDLALSEDTLAIWLSNNRRAMAGEIVREEVEFSAKGGTRVYYNSIAPIQHNGQVLGVLGVNIDITERKQMEEALQKAHDELEHRVEERTAALSKSNCRLREEVVERGRVEGALRRSRETARAILNAATDSCILVDPECTLLAINEVGARRLGGTPEELVGRCGYDLIGPDLAKSRKAQIDEAVRTGKAVRHEDERDGIAFDIHVLPILGVQDRVERLAVFARDITQQRRAEKALRSSEERLRFLLSASSAVIYTCQPGGEYAATFISENVKAQLGYESRMFLDDPQFWAKNIHPDDAPRVFAELQLLHKQDVVAHEYRFRRSDGAWRWMREEVRLVHGANGNPQEFVGCWVDVTERSEAEERARLRLGQLAQALRLSTTGSMATELAHELNQPLAAISFYAGGCLRRMQSDTITLEMLREPIEKIAMQASQAGEIIQHIRGFINRPATELSTFNINDLIREVVEFVEYATRRRQVVVKLEPGAPLPLLRLDKIRIEQVVANLVVNAIDALDKVADRDRRVHIQTTLNQRDEVEVAVSDNGPGIPPELADRIFEPFFTTAEQGMGMGLAISRSIVGEYGGRLWMTPNRDHGVAFRFTLPKSIKTDS